MTSKHAPAAAPTTALCDQDEKTIFVRGRDLVNDLVGKRSFTEMLYFVTCGRMPSAGQACILDACLVTLMEHGINPSTMVTRLISSSNPQEPQMAIAAGLLAIGGQFGGTSEQCAQVLVELAQEVRSQGEGAVAAFAQRLIAQGAPVAGFGHLHHKPDDPRAPRLFAVAGQTGLALPHADLLRRLSTEIDRAKGKHLTINATGAIGALLLDIDVPLDAIRCFCVVSRSAGLVGHLVEEKNKPSALALWRAGRAAVPYVPD